MDGHPPQQSSDVTPPPDDRLDEDAPATTDASSTARAAPRRGRRKGWRKDKGKDTSSTRDPRRSTRRSLSAGGHSSERSTAGSSGGGGSIWDSAHDCPRGDEIRTGESYFNIRRWSSAPRDNEEEEPPRQRRKVQWSYVDGSTYVGEALDEKRDGQGTLTRHRGVWDGVFKNGNFDEGTAMNVKWGDHGRYTGQIVGGKLNGTGKITLADGGEFEGTFVDNRLDKGMAKNMKLKFLNDVCTYTGQMAGKESLLTLVDARLKATLPTVNSSTNAKLVNGGTYTVKEGVFVDNFLREGKITFADGEVHDGVFDVDGLRKGKITFADEEVHEGVFDVGGLREGKITFPPEGRNGEVKMEGVFVDGRLNGHGKIALLMEKCTKETLSAETLSTVRRLNGHGKLTYDDGGIIKGTFVDGNIDSGTAENVKCDDGNIIRVRLFMVYRLGLGQPGKEIKAAKRRLSVLRRRHGLLESPLLSGGYGGEPRTDRRGTKGANNVKRTAP
ncbi:hypothetical protein THAOC_24403 [Thalassiosira oceanica]|uniref:Uncharacterized protein n=1 Tax=Thalassiosira oceanica TaxID=159749 RepID=K0S4G1_THAOC|nr:hypothetical protein THAOC_24403 [Thalassiosira oceanica]|eukprot:EJK55821.1 hypothetical protein THAOC_24403 [Thalassiosira oceanica]